MILLDTNVASELLRLDASPGIAAWLERIGTAELGTTTITVFEMEQGLAQMPMGRRRAGLENAMADLFGPGLLGARIFTLDRPAAVIAGRVAGGLARQGRMIDTPDALIAGIALHLDATLATRNTRHFERVDGLRLVNPWA